MGALAAEKTARESKDSLKLEVRKLQDEVSSKESSAHQESAALQARALAAEKAARESKDGFQLEIRKLQDEILRMQTQMTTKADDALLTQESSSKQEILTLQAGAQEAEKAVRESKETLQLEIRKLQDENSKNETASQEEISTLQAKGLAAEQSAVESKQALQLEVRKLQDEV